VAPRLATVLRSAQPTARALRPLLRDVRATLPVLDEALVRLPRLETQAVPALEQTTDAVRALRPAVRGLRPFTPDLLHGILTSFGGRAGSNYDAIGHVGRISPIVNGASFPAVLRPIVGALDPLLEAIGFNGLGGYDARNLLRCPGGATGPAADGSRPWRDGVEGTCDVIDDGNGR
jgi:phospholipid/cholesterol/gamma-HCH transport system substrate-binding protein